MCVQIGPTAQSRHLLHFIRKSIRRKKELQISSASSNGNINIKVNLKFALQQSWNFVLFYQGGMIEDALNDETELVWTKQKKAPAQWIKAESRRPSPDGWGDGCRCTNVSTILLLDLSDCAAHMMVSDWWGSAIIRCCRLTSQTVHTIQVRKKQTKRLKANIMS